MKALVKTRIYRQARLKVGPLVILGLELLREDWGEARLSHGKTGGRMVASLYNIASSRTHREYKALGEGYFVETEVSGLGHTASDGEGRLRNARMLICPHPSKLHSVTVKYKGGEAEVYRLPPGREFYVYEGFIDAEKAWEHIVVEAESCRRVILDTEARRKNQA